MWWMVTALAGGVAAGTPADCSVAEGTVFAESVVSFAPGGGVEQAWADPATALGPPDFHEGTGAVSLGNRVKGGAQLVLAFHTWALIDGPGADLVVHEAGPSAEPTELAVSVDGVTWFEVGVIAGAVREVDIAGKAPAGDRFGYVRLRTANKRDTAAPWAGPDIDALGLNHACQVRRSDS
jgi:hypothetical protein